MVRSSLGSPLISPGLLCLLSRPALHAEPVFNMAAHPGSQSNNKLYLQLSAGLNHWDYCSTKCWIPVNIPAGEKGKQTQRDKYRPPLHRNILWSSQSRFHHLQIWHGSQKGERMNLSFNECGQSQWNSFFGGRLSPTNVQSVILKEPSAGLLFAVPWGTIAGAHQAS